MTTRRHLDLHHLPSTTFGHRDLLWWGVVAFIVIESTTMAILASAVLYLRRNFETWPPAPLPPPGLLLPTINMVLIVLASLPMVLVDRAGRRHDLAGVRRWMLVAIVLAALVVALRFLEFGVLGVRWDGNAYGSVIWTLMGFHTSLLVVDLAESASLAVLTWRGPWEEKHFVDASNNAAYSYFLPASWLPIYCLIVLWPNLS